MTWADFYFICFIVGFALSLLTFVMGSLHLQLPHLHFDVGGHVHFDPGSFGGGAGGGAHAGAADGAHAHGHAGGGHGSGLSNNEPEISWFNFGTVCAFLSWFGGTGFLMTRYSGVWSWLIFMMAVLSGMVGASLILFFIVKVLLPQDKALDPSDYEMVGVLGRVTVTIREGGTGEIVFSQEGIRRCCGARSERGEAIAKGTEVVVTKYEHGLAYVRCWDELTNEAETGESAGAK
jgi:membrane protein implicated in regulation of membrane protease activity